MRVRGLILGLGALLLVAGCSSSDDGDAATDTTEAVDTPDTSDEATDDTADDSADDSESDGGTITVTGNFEATGDGGLGCDGEGSIGLLLTLADGSSATGSVDGEDLSVEIVAGETLYGSTDASPLVERSDDGETFTFNNVVASNAASTGGFDGTVEITINGEVSCP